MVVPPKLELEELLVLDELLETAEIELSELLLETGVLGELLETAVLDELLATTILLTDEAVLVGVVSGDFEPPPPPQPLRVRAKIRMLLGIKRDGARVSKFMIPSTD